MKQKIKKYLGEILTIIGTGIFINNLFRFSYFDDWCSGAGLLPSLSKYGTNCEGTGGVAYYYSADAILLLTLGSVLIIAGILIIKNRAKINLWQK